MDKFCGECGTEIVEGEAICRNCGHAVVPTEPPQRGMGKQSDGIPPITPAPTQTATETETPAPVPSAPKKKLTKMQKFIRGTVGALLVLVIGFSMWATSTHSAESIAQQFNDAVVSKDAEKISKLAVHEDGSSIKDAEAKALLKLVKAEGKNTLDSLSTVVPHKKFLGVYNNHKIELIDQYAKYDEFIDALDFKFNKTKIAEYKRSAQVVVFGPLSPGIYDVEVAFEGEYGSTSNAVSIGLMSAQHDEQWMDLDLSIANVTFEIEDDWGTNLKEAHLLVNDEKFPVSEDGYLEEIGPLLLDGSQKVTAKINAPWGEVSSVETAIDSDYITLELNTIADEQYKKIVELLAKYGEEYVKAASLGDVSKFTTLNENGKELLKAEFEENEEYDAHFSGKFKMLKVDKDSLYIVLNEDTKEIQITARFIYDLQNQDKTFEEWVSQESISLTYNKEKSEWLIDDIDRMDYGEFNATDDVEGSAVLYESVVKSAQESKDLEEALANFMYDYHDTSVFAINERDFSYVAHYYTTTGKSREKSREYIDYLESKGITEEHVGTELESYEAVNDSTWKVTTIDEYYIIKNDSRDYKKFRSITIVKKVDGDLLMDELITTDPI